ncbi:unnamed protein product [Merluccius merluccius]
MCLSHGGDPGRRPRAGPQSRAPEESAPPRTSTLAQGVGGGKHRHPAEREKGSFIQSAFFALRLATLRLSLLGLTSNGRQRSLPIHRLGNAVPNHSGPRPTAAPDPHRCYDCMWANKLVSGCCDVILLPRSCVTAAAAGSVGG